MTQRKSFKQLVSLQQLMEKRAEGDLVASRHTLRTITHAIDACARQVSESIVDGNAALAQGDTRAWLVTDLAREVAAWRSRALARQRTEAEQHEAHMRAIFLEKRVAVEQTKSMLNTALSAEKDEAGKRAQKMLDEFAIQRCVRISNP